jgi:hypothetical protein
VNAQTNFPEELSSGTLKIKALDWGNLVASDWNPPYDGIVASDVLYLPQYFDALIHCMRAQSSPRTVILLTGFIRGAQAHQRWVEAARDYFTITTVTEKKCVDDDGDDTAGLEHQETWFVLKLTKKDDALRTSALTVPLGVSAVASIVDSTTVSASTVDDSKKEVNTKNAPT